MSPLAEVGDFFLRRHRQGHGFLDALQDILGGKLPVLGERLVHGRENRLFDFRPAELVGLFRQPRDIVFLGIPFFQAEVNLENHFSLHHCRQIDEKDFIEPSLAQQFRRSEESERLVIQRTTDFTHANKELKKQVTTRERVEAELRDAHEELEKRVQERTAKLVQANEELKTEISERKRAEDAIYQLNQELVEQRDQLELSNKELEAFSYSVAHDLRAPLRGIDGFSQAVLEDYGEILEEKGKSYLRRVREASQRMAKLIDAMLDLARLTRAEIHPELTDFTGIVESIVSDFQKLEPDRQVEWVIVKDIQVEADPDLLRVVMQNLLGNAWKFSGHESEARIEVGITYQYSQPVYFVRDNGVGFDMTYVNKLFWAFHRLHAINEFPGIGIGLATVKRIVGRHGGRIWADATEGKGATFYFTLDS